MVSASSRAKSAGRSRKFRQRFVERLKVPALLPDAGIPLAMRL